MPRPSRAGVAANYLLGVKLTEEERAAVHQLAAARGTTVADLVRAWIELAASGVLREAPAAPTTIEQRTPAEVVNAAFDDADAALARVQAALEMLPRELPTLVGDWWSPNREVRFATPEQAMAEKRTFDLFRQSNHLHKVAWGRT